MRNLVNDGTPEKVAMLITGHDALGLRPLPHRGAGRPQGGRGTDRGAGRPLSRRGAEARAGRRPRGLTLNLHAHAFISDSLSRCEGWRLTNGFSKKLGEPEGGLGASLLPHVRSLDFFRLLRWIDGRPLLYVIEPYRQRILAKI